MSSIYVLEPPTAGKVVMRTTLGDVDLELWPKEAPKAVRNFVQLCLEGYYNNTIFHRIIKGFMVQGGDPTGTGTGGESIYGVPFRDEFHSRLRFSHRGILACANQQQPHSNGSQFFFTLDRCDWLDKKHTIFGKITGDTIYNALKFGDLEVDSEDAPLDPPKVITTQVLWNPFEDIVPRTLPAGTRLDTGAEATAHGAEKQPRGSAGSRKKQLNLLSFGEEAEEDETEEGDAAFRMKLQSSHDVLKHDPRLLPVGAVEQSEGRGRDGSAAQHVEEQLRGRRQGERGGREGSVADTRVEGRNRGGREVEKQEKEEKEEAEEEGGGRAKKSEDAEEADDDFDARMRQAVLQRQSALLKAPSSHPASAEAQSHKNGEGNMQQMAEGREGNKGKEAGKEESRQSEREGPRWKGTNVSLKSILKSRGGGGIEEDARQRHKAVRRSVAAREEHTLARLSQFQSRLRGQANSSSSTGGTEHALAGARGVPDAHPSSVRAEEEVEAVASAREEKRAGEGASGGVGGERHEEEEEEEGEQLLHASPAWLKHQLKFQKNPSAKGDMDRNDDPNQYVVHDPLLEKGKQKFNRMQAKAKKRGREWAGRSLD